MTTIIPTISVGLKRVAKLLDAVTAPLTGTMAALCGATSTVQAIVTGIGAVSATVIIQYSNDSIGWIDGATITLTGTDTATDGFATEAAWVYARANLTALIGTNAAVTVTMAI
jgi:hypothetical protein